MKKQQMTSLETQILNRIRRLHAEALDLASEIGYIDFDDKFSDIYGSLDNVVYTLEEAINEVDNPEYDAESEEDVTYEELKEPWDKDDTEAQLAWIMDECYKLFPVDEWKDAVIKHIEDRNAAIRRSIRATGTYRPLIRNPFVN